MAISKGNVLLQGLSGHIAKQLVVKQYGDKTVVTNYPKKRKKLSRKQKAIHERMLFANVYAKGVMKDEQKRNEAQIRLDVTRNKLYTSLVKEYFKNNPQFDQARLDRYTAKQLKIRQ